MARFDDDKPYLYEDTTTYTVTGEGKCFYSIPHQIIIAKGQEYAEKTSKSFHIASIIATVKWGHNINFTTKVNLTDKEPYNAWSEVLKVMRNKHNTRPNTKKLLGFTISIDFFFSRFRDGVVPEHMKPTAALSQKA